jgi:DNA-binding transcriptional ArsR family regulator
MERWAIAHPLRLQLWHLLADGPGNASGLARRLGESRSLVSYHLRMLGKTGAIVDVPELGNARERWWRRPQPVMLGPIDDDFEGRAINVRTFGIFFARDEEARRRLLIQDVGAAWRAAAFAGNWFVEITPDEADAFAERLYALVQEVREQSAPSEGADRALVSISVLPWLDAGGSRVSDDSRLE